MRDYAELIKQLIECGTRRDCLECPYDSDKSYCIEPRIIQAADAIEELQAAVRSVVRCKDCKWCHAGYCEKYDDLIPFGCANKPWEDWFCADGKRREAKKEAQDAD